MQTLPLHWQEFMHLILSIQCMCMWQGSSLKLVPCYYSYIMPVKADVCSFIYFYTQLDFEECFHEHKSTRTFLQLHTFLSLTYKYTKIAIYHILVIIVGIWFAIAWAVINAAVAFFHAWVYGPMLKLMLIIVYMLNPLYSVPVRVLLRPPVDTIGRLCRCEDKVTNTQCNI